MAREGVMLSATMPNSVLMDPSGTTLCRWKPYPECDTPVFLISMSSSPSVKEIANQALLPLGQALTQNRPRIFLTHF